MFPRCLSVPGLCTLPGTVSPRHPALHFPISQMETLRLKGAWLQAVRGLQHQGHQLLTGEASGQPPAPGPCLELTGPAPSSSQCGGGQLGSTGRAESGEEGQAATLEGWVLGWVPEALTWLSRVHGLP